MGHLSNSSRTIPSSSFSSSNSSSFSSSPLSIFPFITFDEITQIDQWASNIFHQIQLPQESQGWECMYQHNHPIQDSDALWIWRRLHSVSGLFEYCIWGTAPYPAYILHHVLFDLDYHKSWDKSSGDMYLIHRDEEKKQELCYWEILYPWPLASRDYVYQRKLHTVPENTLITQVEKFIVCSKAIKDDLNFPEFDKKVRVWDYHAKAVIEQCSKNPNQCKYVMFMHEDIRGNIPKPAVNFAVSKLLPNFTKAMYRACEKLQSMTR
jgi:StAR-related lipid transfer protein 7, mitochondrial